jgi:hypothetical protein
MFAPVLDPTHRMAAFDRQPADANLFGQQNSLVPEAASDIRGDDSDLAFVEAETLSEAGAHDVRHLAGRIERELLEPCIPQCYGAAPLNRRHALPRRLDLPRDFDRCVQRLFEIGLNEGFEENIVAPLLMNERGRRGARREHVVDCRQFLDVDGDAGCNVFGDGSRRCHTHGDRFADEPHLVGGQAILIGRLEAAQRGHGTDRLHRCQIGRAEDGFAVLLRRLNSLDAAMRNRTPDEGDILHTGKA